MGHIYNKILLFSLLHAQETHNNLVCAVVLCCKKKRCAKMHLVYGEKPWITFWKMIIS